MGKNKIKKPHYAQSAIKEYIEHKSSIKDFENKECFVISLKHFDKSQSKSFEDWQTAGMLAQSFEVLMGYCNRPAEEQFSKNFTAYPHFPPKDKTDFVHPTYVPEDAKWCRIHVNGTHILVGHIYKNTFYLTFLDDTHSFWKSELKHT